MCIDPPKFSGNHSNLLIVRTAVQNFYNSPHILYSSFKSKEMKKINNFLRMFSLISRYSMMQVIIKLSLVYYCKFVKVSLLYKFLKLTMCCIIVSYININYINQCLFSEQTFAMNVAGYSASKFTFSTINVRE